MFLDWGDISDDLQILLAREALGRAAGAIAMQAAALPHEIDAGTIADHGGADALRLFAAILCHSIEDPLPPAGMAEPAPTFG
jgi:hypothetical protein